MAMAPFKASKVVFNKIEMLSFARRFTSRALHTHSATARSASTSTAATAPSRRPAASTPTSTTTTSSKGAAAAPRAPRAGTKASRLAAQASLQKRGSLPGEPERVRVAATVGDKGARTAQLVASGVSSHGSAVRLVVLQRGSKLHGLNALTANAVRQIDAQLRKFAGDSLAQSIVIQSEREKGKRKRERKRERKKQFFLFLSFFFSRFFSIFSRFFSHPFLRRQSRFFFRRRRRSRSSRRAVGRVLEGAACGVAARRCARGRQLAVGVSRRDVAARAHAGVDRHAHRHARARPGQRRRRRALSRRLAALHQC